MPSEVITSTGGLEDRSSAEAHSNIDANLKL